MSGFERSIAAVGQLCAKIEAIFGKRIDMAKLTLTRGTAMIGPADEADPAVPQRNQVTSRILGSQPVVRADQLPGSDIGIRCNRNIGAAHFGAQRGEAFARRSGWPQHRAARPVIFQKAPGIGNRLRRARLDQQQRQPQTAVPERRQSTQLRLLRIGSPDDQGNDRTSPIVRGGAVGCEGDGFGHGADLDATGR